MGMKNDPGATAISSCTSTCVETPNMMVKIAQKLIKKRIDKIGIINKGFHIL